MQPIHVRNMKEHPMRLTRLLSFVAAPAAGIAVAIVLTLPGVASAWDINNLPAGFTAYVTSDSSGGPCPLSYDILYRPAGIVSGHLCTDSPTFQQDLDAFVDANYTAPVTTTAAATTTDQGTTTSDPTPGGPPATTTTSDTVTVTVTTVVTDPTVDARLTSLEQRQQAQEARIAALELKNPPILGETKNQKPFTTPV